MSATLEAGFADPVLNGQRVFRAVMDALSRPGIAQAVTLDSTPPLPLTPELAAVALTLCDHDSTVWLDPALASSGEVREWLAFHTGAPVVGRPGDAAFALVSDPKLLPELSHFALGTDEYPDRSTTIVLNLPSLEGGDPLTLRGPGIRDIAVLSPVGLPADFIEQWRCNRAEFPRGVDLLLVASGKLLGLPRTTRVEG